MRTLWDLPPPPPLASRRSDPISSQRAAELAAPRAPSNREKALSALLSAGCNGLTDFELADATGVAQTSIGVRRGELVRSGLVIATTQFRKAPSGADAIVWIATAYQKESSS